MERYKDTKYLVTEDGKVWSEYSNKFLSPGKVHGYRQVWLYINDSKISKLVHRLVAELYISNPNNYLEINHIDNDPSNNRVENLEWCTKKMNHDHKVKQGRHKFGVEHPLCKLTEEQVLEIRKLSRDESLSQRKLAKIYNVDQTLIGLILRRRIWKLI